MNSPLIIALDVASEEAMHRLVDALSPDDCALKIGLEWFSRLGPVWVRHLVSRGFRVFLDLKYHDIPNTVAKACEAATALGVWMVNVHALGGQRMLQAARAAVDKSSGIQKPLLIAVTVLTSFAEEDWQKVGKWSSIDESVLALSKMAHDAKLDGVVCSAHEASAIKANFGQSFLAVTPGIRLVGDESHDQRRIVTPEEGIAMGADYLVIGRSVTGALDPKKAIEEINLSLK